MVKAAAPEPFESRFQKELSEAASAKNPSGARLAAWKKFYTGIRERSGLSNDEILRHAANKFLEVADVDMYQSNDILVYEIPSKDLGTFLTALQKTPYGKAVLEAHRKVNSDSVEAYLKTGKQQNLSNFLTPGVGFGKTTTSNKPYVAPDLSRSPAALENLARGKKLYEEELSRGGSSFSTSYGMLEPLRAAAGLGNIDAMQILADIFKRQNEPAQELEWRLKLADLGDLDSMVYAANYYELKSKSERVDRIDDLRKAERYYTQALAKGRMDLSAKLADLQIQIRWQYASADDARAISKMSSEDRFFFDRMMTTIAETLKKKPYQNVRISMNGGTELQSNVVMSGQRAPLDPLFFLVFHTNRSLGYEMTLSMFTIWNPVINDAYAGTRYEKRGNEPKNFVCTLPTSYENNVFSVSSCEIDYAKARYNNGYFKFRVHRVGMPSAPPLPWGLPPGARAALVLYYDLKNLK